MENIYHKESEDERWNSYFYPGTTTFINKLGITDDNELYKVETAICEEKIEELKKTRMRNLKKKEEIFQIIKLKGITKKKEKSNKKDK